MTSTDATTSTGAPGVGTVDMKLEAVAVPVSDVDRSKRFYQSLGWRLDADIVRGDSFRVVQLTPPHSACSVSFGIGVTTDEPGSIKRLLLAVYDIDEARADLVRRGIEGECRSRIRRQQLREVRAGKRGREWRQHRACCHY